MNWESYLLFLFAFFFLAILKNLFLIINIKIYLFKKLSLFFSRQKNFSLFLRREKI